MSNFKIICETDRLILRTVSLDDASDTFEIYSNPEVMKYIDASETFQNIERAMEDLTRGIAHQEKHGICHWGIVEKSSGKLIGMCGFHWYELNQSLELVVHINQKYWRQGFGYEASQAVIKYAFDNLKFEKIVGLVFPENSASCSLLEKLNFKFVSEIEEDSLKLKLYDKNNLI